MNFNFANFPTLKTDRILLREISFEDAIIILELRSSEEINKFVATKRMRNLAEADKFIILCQEKFTKKEMIFWGIEYEQQIIGTIVLHRISLDENYAEIGYKLKPNYQKKGLMSEALHAIINFGFSKLQLKTIEAFTHKNNISSTTLLKKHNFVFQPERRDKGFENNRIYQLAAGSKQ